MPYCAPALPSGRVISGCLRSHRCQRLRQLPGHGVFFFSVLGSVLGQMSQNYYYTRDPKRSERPVVSAFTYSVPYAN